MTAYDVIMLALVVVGMIWGAWKGLTLQLATVASLTLGVLVAYPLSGPIAARWLSGIDPSVSRWIALALAYVVISAVVFLVAATVRTALKRAKMDAYDRHLGMLTGGIGGLTASLALLLLILTVAPGAQPTIASSPGGKIAERIVSALRPSIPTPLQSVVAPLDDLDRPRPMSVNDPVAPSRAKSPTKPTDRPFSIEIRYP